MYRSSGRRALLTCCSIVAVSMLVACSSSSPGPSAQTAPQKPSDRELATEFFTLLKRHDVGGLDAFLSPAFQIQRADGAYLKKDEYLKNPARVDSFEILDVTGTRYGNTRIIRFMVRTSAIENGKRTTAEPAARMATFVWNGDRWQLAGYANWASFVTTTTAGGVTSSTAPPAP